MVQAAGLAIKALTSSPADSTQGELSDSAQGPKDAFSTSTATYFRLLDSIGVRLRRQIYALEEADIISSDLPSKEVGSVPANSLATSPSSSQTHVGADKGSSLGTGSLGNLDVAWLNSRRDIVGKEMEAQIWAQTKSLLQEVEKQRTSHA